MPPARSLKRQNAFYGTYPTPVGSKRIRTMVKQAVKREMPMELKYQTVSSVVGTPAALAAGVLSVVYLNPIATGDDNFERTGQKISPKYLTGQVSLYQASALVNANVSVIIFIDKENQSALPTTADLLDIATPLSPPNPDRKDRFQILKRYTIQVNNLNSSSEPALQKIYIDLEKIYKRLGPRLQDQSICFNGTTNAIGSASKNALFVGFIADTAVSSSMATGSARSGLDYAFQLAYTDD